MVTQNTSALDHDSELSVIAYAANGTHHIMSDNIDIVFSSYASKTHLYHDHAIQSLLFTCLSCYPLLSPHYSISVVYMSQLLSFAFTTLFHLRCLHVSVAILYFHHTSISDVYMYRLLSFANYFSTSLVCILSHRLTLKKSIRALRSAKT